MIKAKITQLDRYIEEYQTDDKHTLYSLGLLTDRKQSIHLDLTENQVRDILGIDEQNIEPLLNEYLWKTVKLTIELDKE
jgi:hypothetical protein